MKNKNLLFKISIIIASVLILSIIILSLLGLKERVGYLSEFRLNIDKTLEINGLDIEETKTLFMIEDESSITNYIFTNDSITNYSYNFRIKYYSKVFRNSDIYGVYINLDNILNNNDFVKKIKIGEYGSPFGNFISTKIIDTEKIDNVNYILKLKNTIVLYLFIILLSIFIILICFLYKKNIFNFINKTNTILLKNKKVFFTTYLIIIGVVIISIIVLILLGRKERVGYLAEFKFTDKNIDKTLRLNNINIESTKKLFTIDDKLDRDSLTNYIFTNKNITKYSYNFRIKYYDKIFRNSDIYGVYIDSKKIINDNNFINNIKMEYEGSPFGTLESTKNIENQEINNVIYTLKIKPLISVLLIFALLWLLISVVYLKNESFIIKYDIHYAYLLLIVTFIIMFFSLKLYNYKLGLPIENIRGDLLTSYMIAGEIYHEGWFPVITDRLGYPFNSYFGTFPAFLFINTEVFLMKIISLFRFNSFIDIFNIAYILIFPISSIISFYVIRNLKISVFVSIIGALSFAFLPFVFQRIAHYVIAGIYFIPLTILLCIWLYEDDNFLKLNKTFFKNKKNIFSILFIILIANNGISYYQFLSCFFICITALCKFLINKKLNKILSSIIALILLVFFYGINNFPLLMYKSTKSFIDIDIPRHFSSAEVYGTKISHLLLNTKLFPKYYAEAVLVNENSTAYLGIIGIIGFIILILYLFIDSNKYDSRISLLSKLNIGAVLFTTIGGFSSLFAFFITPILRSYNRISVYIAFISILCFSLIVDKYFIKRNLVFYISFIILFSFSLYDQIPNIDLNNKEKAQLFVMDKEFIEDIEMSIPEGSAVYQYPSHPMIDAYAPINGVVHYEELIGYLFSDKLKWSAGGDYGREENKWYDEVSKLDPLDFLNEISYAGFKGFYIDKRLFEDQDYINNFQREVEAILNIKPIIHDNDNIFFYSLVDFKNNSLDKNYIPLINNYINKK